MKKNDPGDVSNPCVRRSAEDAVLPSYDIFKELSNTFAQQMLKNEGVISLTSAKTLILQLHLNFCTN